MTLALDALLLGTRHGSTITLQNVKARVWNGKIDFDSQEVQNSTISRNINVDTFLVCTRANSGTLQQETVSILVKCFGTS
jgi:hypothetical protein